MALLGSILFAIKVSVISVYKDTIFFFIVAVEWESWTIK